jgi:hypothetical protein
VLPVGFDLGCKAAALPGVGEGGVSTVSGAAPTQSCPASYEHGSPPLTAKPLPPTATGPPVWTRSTEPSNLLPSEPTDERPYVALDTVHLSLR